MASQLTILTTRKASLLQEEKNVEEGAQSSSMDYMHVYRKWDINKLGDRFIIQAYIKQTSFGNFEEIQIIIEIVKLSREFMHMRI